MKTITITFHSYADKKSFIRENAFKSHEILSETKGSITVEDTGYKFEYNPHVYNVVRKEDKKALYGVISYTGGQYTVIFEKQTSADGCTSISNLSGYGDFPFESYPNIPVINYAKNDKVFEVLKKNLYVIESSSNGNITLKDFLQVIYNLGIEVLCKVV